MTANEKKQRIVEAAAAILAAAPGRRMNTVVLNKALFYLDLAALRDFGEAVTHNTFVALKQGPVVAHYKRRLIGSLEEAGVAAQEEQGMAKPICLKRELRETRYMTEPLRDLAGKIARWLAAMTSSSASLKSHDNPGWGLAYEEGLKKGDRPCPINLLIAMQQIVDEDPWLDTALDAKELRAVEAAEDLEGTAW